MGTCVNFIWRPAQLLNVFFLLSTSGLSTGHDELIPNPGVEAIKFYLYPKPGDGNYRQEIKYRIESSLKTSSFQPGQLTVFLIHGYNQSPESPKFKVILDAFVSSTFGGNYISMDWSLLAGNLTIPTDNLGEYPRAVCNTPLAGKRLAQFIAWLYSSRVLDPVRVHLIGFSLGAHAAGEAGREVLQTLGGVKLARITGLDPAGPLFFPGDTSRNIGKGDADFVDIIHTNAGMAGEAGTEGHADFILNSGINQPGCDVVSNIASSCSHDFAAKLFAKSFSVSYFGCKCSPGRFTRDLVEFQDCGRDCRDPVRVGLYTPHSARGVYYVKTGEI